MAVEEQRVVNRSGFLGLLGPVGPNVFGTVLVPANVGHGAAIAGAICEGIEIFYMYSAVEDYNPVTFVQLPGEGEQVASSLSVLGSGSTSKVTRPSEAVVQMRSPLRSVRSAVEIR